MLVTGKKQSVKFLAETMDFALLKKSYKEVENYKIENYFL